MLIISLENMEWQRSVWTNSCLFRSSFACSEPLSVAVNVCQGCALVSWVEGEKMNLGNSCPCLERHKILSVPTRNWLECSLVWLLKLPERLRDDTSWGSASVPTIAASMASWFSTLEARAASNITPSLSTELLKHYKWTTIQQVSLLKEETICTAISVTFFTQTNTTWKGWVRSHNHHDASGGWSSPQSSSCPLKVYSRSEFLSCRCRAHPCPPFLRSLSFFW